LSPACVRTCGATAAGGSITGERPRREFREVARAIERPQASTRPPCACAAACRLVSIECGVLPQANGSARLTLESANTQVLASVKVELVKPPADAPATGTAECNVECWTSASAKFAGRGAVDINSELSSTLNQ